MAKDQQMARYSPFNKRLIKVKEILKALPVMT